MYNYHNSKITLCILATNPEVCGSNPTGTGSSLIFSMNLTPVITEFIIKNRAFPEISSPPQKIYAK